MTTDPPILYPLSFTVGGVILMLIFGGIIGSFANYLYRCDGVGSTSSVRCMEASQSPYAQVAFAEGGKR